MSKQLTIFVNTSDGFEDCWHPFFTLWSRYASELKHFPILLNTEHKVFAFDGLSILPTQVSSGYSAKDSWSECLVKGLDQISTPYVLYLQEDYFLKRSVDGNAVHEALQLLSSGQVDVCYLNQWGPQWLRPTNPIAFLPIPINARYFLSTQAAIWRVDRLRSLVREWENGWAFEKFGTIRMRKLRLRAVQWAGTDAIDYTYTGVIKGKWLPECVEIFARECIAMDFSRRGFYKDGGRLKSKFEVARKLLSNPAALSKSCCSLWVR